jgi:GNAT superfamily N-acetyltransferase
VTRYFTASYEERAVLRDGTAVVLRLLRPDDKQLLRDGFMRLSAESRYARFFAPKTTLSDDDLHYLCDIDQERHFALGAQRESDGCGLGIARFIALDDLASDATVAEAAITVADEAQGVGLGKLLFLRLCAAATERSVERFRCEVLGSNTGMAALLATIAPERTIEVGGGVMTIELAVPPIAPTAQATAESPRGGMYRLFRAAAGNAVEWTEAVRGLWRR